MSNRLVLYLRALLALAALLGFSYLYGRAILDTARGQPTPEYSAAYLYTATTLAGLVGGVAATGLGQSYPAARGASRRDALFQPLGRVLAPLQPENLQVNLAVAYTVVYVIFGLAALIVWVSSPDEAAVHELVRNLGLIFLGLAVATAQTFLDSRPAAVQTRRKKR